MNNPFALTGDDKQNPHYTFTPPTDYTAEEVEKGNKLVEILNNPNLSESEKKDACWEILNKS